ncbi:MAG: nicotinate (nicotinamide) nucleotide adenylyltransferase [Gammaproteobacteria bacterium]
MSKTIGIFGGAFDPVHYGHTESILNLQKKINFKKIHIIPCSIPVLKDSLMAKPNERLKMLEMAFEKYPDLLIDDREITKGGISYTFETLKSIKKDYPEEKHFSFIMGLDAFLNFKNWKNWTEILEMCSIIILQRPKYNLPKNLFIEFKNSITEDVEEFLKSHGKILFTNISVIDISSSQLREDFKSNHFNKDKIDQSVISYIENNALYSK